MSQPLQQVVGLSGQVVQGQIVQGQVMQGQIVTGDQVTAGQVIMTSTPNLSGISQHQIVNQIVTGPTVQGAITANTGENTLNTTQVVNAQTVSEIQQMVSATSNNVQQVICNQQLPVVDQESPSPNNVSQTVNKQPTITQSVPPPNQSPAHSLSDNGSSVITKQRISDLVREVDPNEQLDEDVEELLMYIGDDFIESVTNAACRLAKHRGSQTLEVKDVQMYLERNWHMWIPGFGTEELKPYKRAPTTEAHKQRLALLRKAVKKY